MDLFLKFQVELILCFSKVQNTNRKISKQTNTISTNRWRCEFKPFVSFLQQNGIEHKITCPHTSKQNGIVKTKHRHIMDIGLTLLSQATIVLNFWDGAFSISVYLINRLPTPVLQNLSPLEKLFGKKLSWYGFTLFYMIYALHYLILLLCCVTI